MKSRSVLCSLLVCALLAGCGLKRNLELPGSEKHKPAGDVIDTTPGPVSAGTPAAPAPTPVPSPPPSATGS